MKIWWGKLRNRQTSPKGSHNINSNGTNWHCASWYGAVRTQHLFCGISAKYTYLKSNNEKTLDKHKLRDILQITYLNSSKTSKPWKDQERHNCSTLKGSRDLWQQHDSGLDYGLFGRCVCWGEGGLFCYKGTICEIFWNNWWNFNGSVDYIMLLYQCY